MSRHQDSELEDLFDRAPALEHYANLLRTAGLKPPPLDPNFRPALRRRLMQAAYERFETRRRPSLIARIFSGPGMAVGLAAAAAVLLGFVLVANGGSWFGPGQVQVTTVGAVAVNQPITVSFNQPMDHLSVEKAIQIEPATQVTYAWHGNNLVIQPASGELAPNTQYHVTVAADAKTAPGVKIGQAAVVAVTTAASPPPSPTRAPARARLAPPQITAENTLSGTAGSVIAWSPDGKVLYFSDGGDLKSINGDGTGLKTIQPGVKLESVAPSGSALAYLTTGSSPKLYLAALDGSGAQVVDTRDVSAIGWQNGKPLVVFQTDIGPAGGTPIAKLPNPAECLFSPDASKLICSTINQATQTSPKVAATFLFDIASQRSTTWTGFGQNFAWSPDSARLAYWRDGATFVGAPDGSPGTEIAKSATPVALSWSPDAKLLLLAGADGASIVKVDGGGLHELSQASFQNPVWAPGGGQFAFARGSVLWIDDLTVSGSAIDIGAAGKVVDQYEQARIKNDVAAASGLLTPSASPTTPSPLAARRPHGALFRHLQPGDRNRGPLHRSPDLREGQR